MAVLAVQFCMSPEVAQWVHSGSSSTQYSPFTGVVLTEMVKIVFAVAFVFLNEGGFAGLRRVFGAWRLVDSIQMAGLSALLFAGQDMLVDFANRPQNQCEPLIFLLLNQTKTVWSAVFLWVALDVRRSRHQWLALFLLFLSACLLTYDDFLQKSSAGSEGPGMGLQLWGVAATLGAAFISGVNAMIGENLTRLTAVKRPAMLFATELAVMKIIILIAASSYSGGRTTARGFFDGVEAKSFVLFTMYAMGGICVALLVSNAGGDWKGYSLIAGLCISSVYGYAFKHVAFGPIKLLSIAIVAISLYIYNAFPLPRAEAKTEATKKAKKTQ